MVYTPSGPEEQKFLEEYKPAIYKGPSVTTDVVLFAVDKESLKVLLIRRANYPFKNCWALPGGFVELGEGLIRCALRELSEEAAISDVYLEQALTFGAPNRDPRHHIISVSHVGLTDISSVCAKAGDDAAESEWFTFSGYTSEQKDENVIVQYKLSGRTNFCPIVSHPLGQEQQIKVVYGANIAADHSMIIAYSYAYLMRRIQNGFLELAFKCQGAKERALRVFQNANLSSGL